MRRNPARILAALLMVAVLGPPSATSAFLRRGGTLSHAVRYPVNRGPMVTAPSYEDTAIATNDGLTLRGWFFPTHTDRAAIIVHGKDSNRIGGDNRSSEKMADCLIADGYSVLLFDLRRNGESEGDRFSLGYLERRDVAIDSLELRAASTNSATELWVAAVCQHAWPFNTYPQAYRTRLLAFLDARSPQRPFTAEVVAFGDSSEPTRRSHRCAIAWASATC